MHAGMPHLLLAQHLQQKHGSLIERPLLFVLLPGCSVHRWLCVGAGRRAGRAHAGGEGGGQGSHCAWLRGWARLTHATKFG